jgi:hypothetical protein
MQIPSLFSAIPAAVNSGLRMLGVDASAKVGISEETQTPEEATGLSDALQDVDLTAITPDDFSELIDRLHASGQLSQEAYDGLLGVRLEMDRNRAPHDQPLDLLAMLNAKLAAQSQGIGGDAVEASDLTKRQLSWLNSIASQSGVNALA